MANGLNNGWEALALQTQTISIPNNTIEAFGERTFRTNGERVMIEMTPLQSINSKNSDAVHKTS